jgi:maleylacetate reductase
MRLMTEWSEFVYQALPMRVTFGAGRSAHLADELDVLGVRRVLVLSTPGHAQFATRLAAPLGDRVAGIFAGARMHVPVEVVVEAAKAAAETDVDAYLAVGGGSTVGLGKALALRTALPVVAVPTTYAGSEMTPIWGLTENGAKRTGRDPAVLPRSVIYDPDLTLTLPVGLSVTSGLNSLAHAVEALYAPDASPMTSLMAREGAEAMLDALPRIVAAPDDRSARSRALYGAWLCGAVLGATTMSLHHKLCHVLGGSLDLPHSPTHAVVLPHVLAYNAPWAPTAKAALGELLDGDDPGLALWQLSGRLGAPRALSELGMSAADVPRVVDEVLAMPYANPRSPTADELTALLHAAVDGLPPTDLLAEQSPRLGR